MGKGYERVPVATGAGQEEEPLTRRADADCKSPWRAGDGAGGVKRRWSNDGHYDAPEKRPPTRAARQRLYRGLAMLFGEGPDSNGALCLLFQRHELSNELTACLAFPAAGRASSAGLDAHEIGARRVIAALAHDGAELSVIGSDDAFFEKLMLRCRVIVVVLGNACGQPE